MLDSTGHKFTGLSGVLKVSKGSLVAMKVLNTGNLYKLIGKTQVNEMALVFEEVTNSTRLWHQGIGHMREKGLQILINKKSLPMKSLNLMFYKHCMFGKQCREKFKAGSHVSKGVLDYIHYDRWSPSSTISYGEWP